MKKSSVTVYKSGKFYNAFGDDGWIIHELFGYKYVIHKQGVGFPESAYIKVLNKLEEENISYNVFDKDKLITEYKGISKKYFLVLKKALNNCEVEKRIDRLKEKINNFSLEELELIIEGIECGKYK